MKIQYISDIHLEFYSHIPKNIITPEAEVLCLAGDIGYPFSTIYNDFLLMVSKQFKKVFLIAGNHEYYSAKANYGHTMEEIEDKIKETVATIANVTYLDNSYEDYEGYRFIGSTLWSNCTSGNGINDFRMIKGMSVELYNTLHEIAREYLMSEDITKSPLPIIMITHHLPSYTLIAEKYRKDAVINQYFASNSDDLFIPTIKNWIYGHTHTGSEIEYQGIRFLCNPIGYPGENKICLRTIIY